MAWQDDPTNDFDAVPPGVGRVTVVINTYNHAHFLAESIGSVEGQSTPAAEIIVVDDGSTDDPERVAGGYPDVRLIRQHNQGLAAARNAGLAAAGGEFIAFLDADDRLLPGAIAAGLAALARHPQAVLAYGGYRTIDAAGAPLEALYTPPGPEPYQTLLRGNAIAMHATVLYRTQALRAAGGFDRTLRLCEDYDVYLKLSRDRAITSYPETIAEYRQHGNNISRDSRRMARTVLTVLGRHQTEAAATRGMSDWKRHYAGIALQQAASPGISAGVRLAKLTDAIAISPVHTTRHAARALYRRMKPWLPQLVVQHGRRLVRGGRPIGTVRLGDLAQTAPVHDDFGWGRGTPIDRYYIETFLDACRGDIRGRVLEIGDDSYSKRFGGAGISRQDILHVNAGNPLATIVGDISDPATLPEAAFDCIILTQTLHLIYDLASAAAALHRALKPGGTLLLTVPGMSQIDRGEWGGEGWFWAMTPAAVRRLFAPSCGLDNMDVAAFGNVYAATTFLQGMVVEEVQTAKLDIRDPAYPLIVTLRARKP